MELLVVIGMIAMLLGIGFVVYVSVLRTGEAAATRTILERAQQAERTYRDAIDLPYHRPIPGVNDIGGLLNVLMTHEESRMILQTVGDERLTESEGDWRLTDGWDRAVIYVPPAPGDNVDGYPRRRTSYFVSRGPDGQRGTDDDIFSYEL